MMMTTRPTPLPLLPSVAGEWPALLADLRLLDDRLTARIPPTLAQVGDTRGETVIQQA